MLANNCNHFESLISTWKCVLDGIDLLLAEVSHEILGLPAIVPITEDPKCFLY